MSLPCDKIQKRLQAANLSAIIIPGRDSHDNEYTAANETFRAYASNFKGSAGDAVIFAEHPHHLYTDGRYWLDAEKCLPPSFLLRKAHIDDSLTTDIKNRTKGDVGVDFRCISIETAFQLRKILQDKGHKLVDTKIVQEVWDSESTHFVRPKPNPYIVYHHIEADPVKEKMERLEAHMRKEELNWAVFCQLDEVCWLLNLRGDYVEYNKVIRAILTVEKVDQEVQYVLYSDDISENNSDCKVVESDMPPATYDSMSLLGVQVEPYNSFYQTLATDQYASKGILNHSSASMAIGDVVAKGSLLGFGETWMTDKFSPSPIGQWKACKSANEVSGFKRCHIIDGLALSIGLAELEHSDRVGTTSEWEVAKRLEQLRYCKKKKTAKSHRGSSFETISAYGPNGASAHYRCIEGESSLLGRDSFYLVDSGSHYSGGTTDVTRTIHLGEPTEAMKLHWTLVLKGMIGMTRITFPSTIDNGRLDTLARMHLWNNGLDYEHGTSHGVGHCLSVHEFPPLISKGNRNSKLNGDGKTRDGYVLSIEPGYYLENSYGIRHENLVVAQKSLKGDPWMEFSTLTFVPFQVHKCLVVDLLTPEEIKWINEYHHLVFEALCRELDEEFQFDPTSELFSVLTYRDIRIWLEKATSPIH